MEIIDKRDFDKLVELFNKRDVFEDWSDKYKEYNDEINNLIESVNHHSELMNNCIIFSPKMFIESALIKTSKEVNDKNIKCFFDNDFMKKAETVLTEAFLNICEDHVAFVFNNK